MKHKRLFYTIGFLMIFMLTSTVGFADHKHSGRKYEVTITNITRGQIFSPPVVISHSRNYRLFTLGETVSPELAALAEDGDPDLLTDSISDLPSVFDYAVAGGPVMPGHSVTLKVKVRRGFNSISAAGMLVSTNDAFFAVRNIYTRSWGKVIAEAEAYDAGSEGNSEECAYIPGPPCGNPGENNKMLLEGYVHIHAGIHGIADLEPAMHDWRNPVAKITIRPIY